MKAFVLSNQGNYITDAAHAVQSQPLQQPKVICHMIRVKPQKMLAPVSFSKLYGREELSRFRMFISEKDRERQFYFSSDTYS